VIKIIAIACGLVFLLMHRGVAQEYPQKEVNLELLADELFGFQDLDLNYEELYENIALLLANRINLNQATADELRFLNLLSEIQIQSLMAYRLEYGPLVSVYELQAVPTFDLSTIYKIVPFVRVAEFGTGQSFWKRLVHEENNYFIARYGRIIETKSGFNETNEASRFKGTRDDLYLRFRTSRPGDFSVGFTVEKDAGEEIAWNPAQKQYAFDFTSFHIQTLNKGKIKNLIIGDFQTQFGQGLVMGGSFGYGKGAETIATVRRSNLGFLPYTSVNEAGYKRGAALTVQLNSRWSLSSFYSAVWRDAAIARDTLEDASVTSFQTTGLHRNENELRTRKKLLEQNLGMVLNYKHNSLDAGVLWNSIEFNAPVKRDPQPYNQFTFSGTTLSNAGAFLNYTRHNVTFFSEAAKTVSEGYGLVVGLLGSLTSKLDVAVHYRNYQRNFYSLYANAFAESSLPQNESGIYWGWKYRWNRKYSASGYADLFQFPWLRYRSYNPSEGHEWLFRFNYQPTRNILLFAQMREELKVRNLVTETNLYLTDNGRKRNYWINADYTILPHLKLKTRAQFSTFEIGTISTKGMTLLQDISMDFGKLSIAARYALFDTDDYDNRQYVYERDVWLAYSLPAYSGRGLRNYVLVQYSITKKITGWIRWAQTRYTDREEIGSGADTIDGNVRTDLRVQMRLKL
jgi:hypothetical protein